MARTPTTVAPGVYGFETGPFRWYVVEEGGRLTVVDAGFPGHFPILEEGLHTLGRSLDQIDGVVLTHAHADHMGFAEKLRRRLGVPVFVHRDDVAAAGRPLQLPLIGLTVNTWRPAVAQMLAHAMRYGVLWVPPIRDVVSVDDRDVLDLPGRPRVLHTPGHTRGQVSLLLEDRGVLFSGDTLVTRNMLTGVEGVPVLPARALNHDHAQSLRSLDRLAEIGEVTLLSGHGPPWRGVMREAVAQVRASGSTAVHGGTS